MMGMMGHDFGTSRGRLAGTRMPWVWRIPDLFVVPLLFLLPLALAGCASSPKPPCCGEAAPAGAHTEKSLYQLESMWTSDVRKDIKLSVFQARTHVVALFFTSCQYACPVIVRDMKRIQEALTPELRQSVQFTLVSFDTERDTPSVLREYRERQGLGTGHWSLLTGKPDDVRELAALLGINYQKDSRGQFAHSNVITVLDPDGEIAHQQSGLNQDPAPVVKAIQRAGESSPGVKTP